MDAPPVSNAPAIEGAVVLAQSSPFLQAYFQRAFSRLGVEQVSLATDGKRALELLSGGNFLLLLLDLDLPEISGLELLEILRSDHSYDDLPIVVTTNNCSSATVKRALELGVSDFLAKPYSQGTVDERILDAIRSTDKPPEEGPTILIAHRDRSLHDGVVEAFGRRAQVTCAHNLGVFLARAARSEPDTLVIEPTMFGPRLDFFLRSVTRIRGEQPVVISMGRLLPGQEAERYLGAIPDERDPEALCRNVSNLLESAGAVALPGMPGRQAFISIIEQAFGMLAGIDVAPLEGQPAAPGASSVTIDLLRDGEPVWTLELQANPETAMTVTADMMGADRTAVAPEHSLRGLGEIARVVARRIRQIALESAIELEVGHPRRTASAARGPMQRIVFGAEDLEPFSAALGASQPEPQDAQPEADAQSAQPVYLLLFRGDRRLVSTERQSILDAYRAWIDQLNEQGAMLAGSDLDPGPPQIIQLKAPETTDAASPPDASSPVLGCWMIEARGDAQAAEWARKLPFGDGSVEVRRIGALAATHRAS